MIQKSDIERLVRFRKGLSDWAENQYVYSLFSKNEESEEFKQHIFREFNEYTENNLKEDHQLSYLLDRIHHIIHKKANREKHHVMRRIYKWYSVAAVLLSPILVAGIFLIAEQKPNQLNVTEAPAISTLYAPMGSRISFSLPDGTNGWLNSGSSLKYSLPFCNDRQITVKGEAWFDVSHDKDHPFEISVGKSKVKVLGTKFNMNAYPEENDIEIVLEEGKVNFSTPGLTSDVEMKPNERLIFSNDSVNIGPADASKYSAWIDGRLVFRSDPMIEVAKRIERWYNVKVELMDKDIEKDLISGTFQDDSLEDVLYYLSMTSPIRYEILEQQVNAGGVIQKTRVLLYRRKYNHSK